MYFRMQKFSDMSVRQINKAFREMDESHLYPICGKFNATERAIRRVRKLMQHCGSMGGFEYACMLETEISNIVNSH